MMRSILAHSCFAGMILGCLVGTTVHRASAQSSEGGVAAIDWPDIQEKARKEGRVVVYATPPILDRLKPDFEKANPGIELEFSRGWAGSEVAAKVDAERQSGADGADLIIITDMSAKPWYADKVKGRLLVAPAGPDATTWPSDWMWRGVTPVVGMEPMVIAYNTNIIRDRLTGYQDLLKPEFKGKFASMEFATVTIATWYDWLERTQGPDFLAKFAAQHPHPYTGSVAAAQAVAAGELNAVSFATMSTIKPLIAMGAPIRMVIPAPSFGVAYTAAILRWAKRPNAAQVFMNYLLSPRGQEAWSGRGESASPRPGIPGSLDSKTVNASFPDITPDEFNKMKDRWIQLVNTK